MNTRKCWPPFPQLIYTYIQIQTNWQLLNFDHRNWRVESGKSSTYPHTCRMCSHCCMMLHSWYYYLTFCVPLLTKWRSDRTSHIHGRIGWKMAIPSQQASLFCKAGGWGKGGRKNVCRTHFYLYLQIGCLHN